MKDAASIKRAVDRAAQAVTLRASLGQGTATTKATLRDGLACDVEEGAFHFVVGMHEGYGGSNEGPNPGTVGRAALAGCLAIGIGMWAARMEIALDALEVVVEADYDVRGELGVDDKVMPGYAAMRYDIRVQSAAPEAKVREMLDTAVRTSSFVDNFARAVPVTGTVRVTKLSVDDKLQLRIQRYGWDKAAEHYERFWAHALAPAQRRMLELAALRPGEKVLDVACGTGLVTFPAAEAVGTTGSVLATDLSEEMVKSLRASAIARGLRQVSAKRLDAQSLEVEDGTFDAAICALGLMYVPDPVVALREMKRAVRPGARVVVGVWGARKNCGWAEIFPIVDKRVASEVCPMFFQLGGEGVLEMTMTMAGLSSVRVERISAPIHYASGEEACGAAFIAGPVALAYSRFTEEMKEGARAEYLASIEGYRKGEAYLVPGEFVVGIGN